MARPPMTSGSSKKPPNICSQVTGWPIFGRILSGNALVKFEISAAFSFHAALSFFLRDVWEVLLSVDKDETSSLAGVTLAEAGGASRLKRVLTERTKSPFESPKNMLSAIPRTNRNRYGFR